MANPVLVNDLRRSLFRRRPVLAVFCMAIAIFVLTILATFSGQEELRNLSRYIPVWNVPDLMLPIIVPAFASGSFAREHEQRTWDDVLLTMLGGWEIIRGKFLACLLPTIVAIIVMFPPFAMLLMLQGVTWSLDIGPWVLIVLIKFLISAFFYISLVMLFSYFCKNGRTALVASYVLLACYAFASYVVWVVVAPAIYDLYVGVDPDSSIYNSVHRSYGYGSSQQFSLSPIELTHSALAPALGLLSLLFLRWRLGKRG